MSAAPIIVGHDAGPGGEDALALGEVLRELAGSPLVVARVLPWSSSLLGPKHLARALEAETAAEFAVLGDRLGPDVAFRALADRSPARALHELAAEERSAAIVVGSSHRGRLGRTLLGSVGAALLNGAPCAVAVAPKGFAAKPGSLGTIAVALDGSPEGWAALETAISLAQGAGASILILTVVEPATYGYSEALGVLSAEGVDSMERAEAERVISVAEARTPEAVATRAHLLDGHPGRALAEAAGDADLLVCGSRGYGPIRHTVLGSTSKSLIANAPCPIMVLPRGTDAASLGAGRTSATPATA